SASTPARHRKATAQRGASRPRKERSSTPRRTWQQRRFTSTTGSGQKTERISSATNAAAARRRLASIDIEPLSDHLQLVDMTIAAEGRRVRAARGDHARMDVLQAVRVDDALDVARHVPRPEVRTPIERDPLGG